MVQSLTITYSGPLTEVPGTVAIYGRYSTLQEKEPQREWIMDLLRPKDLKWFIFCVSATSKYLLSCNPASYLLHHHRITPTD